MTDLTQAIATETVDTLKKYYATLFGVKPKQNRKADLTSALAHGFADTSHLQAYWRQLPERQRQLIQECLFTYNGRVDRKRFRMKYGDFPEKPRGSRSFFGYDSALPDSIALFFYPAESNYGPKQIPAALVALMTSFVEPPAADTLVTAVLPEPLPAGCSMIQREATVLNELSALLILLQNQQLKVGEKTGQPSGATLKKVAKEVHEYYPATTCPEAAGMEFIVAYGWVQLIANSPFCKQSKTTLAPARKTDQKPVATIKVLWEHWLKNRKQDEFRRIDNIKGQNGKGKRYFTNPVERREAIIAALRECPVNTWVSFDQLSRHMFITGSQLLVTTEPEYLYLYDANYGMLHSSWFLLESRYLRCFLLEYAATLGLIDVVIAPPEMVGMDEDRTWGTDDMDCLSRYDGLQYIRLTPLGAYILGLADDYQPSEKVSTETPLNIHRQGRIVFEAPPTPWEQQFLSLYAEQDKGHVWMLSSRKIMETLQVGGNVAELQQFLLARESQPFLPEDCESFLTNSVKNADGVKFQTEALVYSCKSVEMADLIINDKALAKFCQRLGKLQIVLPKSKEKSFREGLNTLGIGCV